MHILCKTKQNGLQMLQSQKSFEETQIPHVLLNYPYLAIKKKVCPKKSGCGTIQGLIGKGWINNFLVELALKVINIKHVKLWLFHVLYYYPLDEVGCGLEALNGVFHQAVFRD